MSGGVQQSMFFLGLPDLKKLCCVTLSLQEDDEEPRSKQLKTCRELVLLYSDILVSPGLDSFTHVTVVMAIPFFQKGVLQAFGQRHGLQVGSPQCVFPGVLQCCLSYSLITRLSPSWNKAGLYLINGKDFLSESGRLNAVSMQLSTCEGHLCISIEANTVRLPPTTLEDFDLPPLVLQRFCSDPGAVLDPSSTGGTVWCHILPSMKKGQIITISRQLPRDGPFRTYRDLQKHWNCLYGYRLPDLAEEEVVYCSVYFRLVGERLFTYPLSCIRLQPAQRCPRVDLRGALGSFLSDVRGRLQSVCGFPARLTSRPCYPTVGLNTAATVQVHSGEQVNLTTSSSSSIRPVLTQLPPPPPRPVKRSFGSQPAAWAAVSQQDRAGWPSSSSSSSSRVSFSFSDSSGYMSAPSSLSLPLSQPAPSSSSSSSSVLPPLHPLSEIPVISAPKLVPIFKNKCPSRHVNVALLRHQKQLIGGVEERGRVALPTFGKTSLAAASASSSSCVSFLSAASLPVPPARIVPRFSRRPKPAVSPAPQTAGTPKVKHVPTLSPASKPAIILTAKPEPKLKSSLKTNGKFSRDSAGPVQPAAAAAEPPPPSSEASNSTKRVMFESKPKKSRSAIRDVDVEQMARSYQLSKLNSATLLAWLKGRGVRLSAKHRKEELMLKVMSCLAES